MVDATLFVAIAIGCVVALLLLTVMFVYCLKRHHDKQQNRELHDRRAREERHRRQLMRAQVVQPPPYDPQRRNVLTMVQEPVPFSPPPEYKELATPLPPRDGQDGVVIGIGGMREYGVHQSPRTRNVAPVNTSYSNNNNNINNSQHLRQQHQRSQGNSSNNRNNNSNNANNDNNNNNNTNANMHSRHYNRVAVNAPVDIHTSQRTMGPRSSDGRGTQISGHAHGMRQTHPQHPPRHDPPSYSSLQHHRATDNVENSSNISTISLNSSNSNNNNNPQIIRNNPASEPVSSRTVANNNLNLAPSRTPTSRNNDNGASNSSSSTNRGQVMTSGPLSSSGLNSMPEIEDLSLI